MSEFLKKDFHEDFLKKLHYRKRQEKILTVAKVTLLLAIITAGLIIFLR